MSCNTHRVHCSYSKDSDANLFEYVNRPIFWLIGAGMVLFFLNIVRRDGISPPSGTSPRDGFSLKDLVPPKAGGEGTASKPASDDDNKCCACSSCTCACHSHSCADNSLKPPDDEVPSNAVPSDGASATTEHVPSRLPLTILLAPHLTTRLRQCIAILLSGLWAVAGLTEWYWVAITCFRVILAFTRRWPSWKLSALLIWVVYSAAFLTLLLCMFTAMLYFTSAALFQVGFMLEICLVNVAEMRRQWEARGREKGDSGAGPEEDFLLVHKQETDSDPENPTKAEN